MIEFGTKAETLTRLSGRLARSYCLPLVSFTVAEWRAGRASCLERIGAEFGAATLIVRSSARSEDTAQASNAGAYLSVMDVDGADADDVAGAIERVIGSYRQESRGDQVLVQAQLEGARLSGVISTCEIATGMPYYIFNYDDESGSTRSVTSGEAARLKTYVRFRGASQPYPSPDLERVGAAIRELEAMVSTPFEAEVAVDSGGGVCLFQARPIATVVKQGPPVELIADWLTKTAKKVEKLSRPHPHLHGQRSVFGVMPDWNPAEIIGLRPRTLALTLYKELITDAIWAYMRDNYGYRNLRSFPLMISLLGVPYIDVRVSFNSFVPKTVPDALSEKLINYYVEQLIAAPHAHDKVEFDIVFSCYYPGIQRDIRRLEGHGFTAEEIADLLTALRGLTNRIIDPTHGFWRGDLAKIEHLRACRRQVLESPMSRVDKIYWLIEDCKRFGTLPFCGLARAGFIAAQFLRGLVSEAVLTVAERDAFMGSLDTIANRLAADSRGLRRGELPREVFLERYGHLRPGTYDILSPRYDEAFDRYFGTDDQAVPADPQPVPFELSPEQRRRIAELLASEGLNISVPDVMLFLKTAIEGREYAKLIFTQSLSDAMIELEALGVTCGLGREELSHLNITTALKLYSTLDALDLRDIFLRDIEANRRAHEMTQAIKLPDLILSPDDVFHFVVGDSQPNYVTSRSVTAGVVTESEMDTRSLAGQIAFIRAADPGYDWIFTKGIAGLVTQFGGANSHMAIRTAEQGIPAIIGCGERNYEAWSRAQCLEIDCANRVVRVIR